MFFGLLSGPKKRTDKRVAGQDGFEVYEGKGVGGGVEDLCVGGSELDIRWLKMKIEGRGGF